MTETTVERIAQYIDTLSGNLPETDAEPDFANWARDNAFALDQLRKNLDESMSYADRAMIAPKLRAFNLRLKEKIARYGAESETKTELRRLQQFVESRTPGTIGEYTVEGAGATAELVSGLKEDASASLQREVKEWTHPKGAPWHDNVGRLILGSLFFVPAAWVLKKSFEKQGFWSRVFKITGAALLAGLALKLWAYSTNPQKRLAELDPASHPSSAPRPPVVIMPPELAPPAPKPPVPPGPGPVS